MTFLLLLFSHFILTKTSCCRYYDHITILQMRTLRHEKLSLAQYNLAYNKYSINISVYY